MLERLKHVAPDDRMTVAEFFNEAPEKRKAELIDGVLLIEGPAPNQHEELWGFLLSVMRVFVRARNLGDVLGPRTAVDLGVEYQAYEPDILFVRGERAEIVQPQGVIGPPDLVIEILSRGTKAIDRGIKRKV